MKKRMTKMLVWAPVFIVIALCAPYAQASFTPITGPFRPAGSLVHNYPGAGSNQQQTMFHSSGAYHQNQTHYYRHAVLAHNRRLYHEQLLLDRKQKLIQEAALIQKKYDQEKLDQAKKLREHAYQQRQLIAQDVFKEQASKLDQQLAGWEHAHPMRVSTYRQTIKNSGQQAVSRYLLSPSAHSCLVSNGYNFSDYTLLDGNPLQHQLLHEVIDGVEAVSLLPQSIDDEPFNFTMHKATLGVFDDARKANAMGDCLSASKLIDLGITLLDYCHAVAYGFVAGAIQGASDAVTGTYHMVRHPLATAKALGHVALKIVEITHDFIPIYRPLLLCSTEQERVKALENHECIVRNWNEAQKKVSRWWQEAPSRDKVHAIIKGTTSTITGIIIGSRCLDLIGKVGKLASAQALAFCKVPQARAVAAGVQLEFPATVSTFMNETENVRQTSYPAVVLLENIRCLDLTIEYGQKLGYSAQEVTAALKTLENEGGSITRFCKAVDQLKNVPGINRNIELVLAPNKIATSSEFFKLKGALNGMRGAFFELESALQAIERGEEVIEIGKKITGPINTIGTIAIQEFDVATKTKLIECKNLNWTYHLTDGETLKKTIDVLSKQLEKKNIIAKEINKKLILHTKHVLPAEVEFDVLRNFLLENNITLIEG